MWLDGVSCASVSWYFGVLAHENPVWIWTSTADLAIIATNCWETILTHYKTIIFRIAKILRKLRNRNENLFFLMIFICFQKRFNEIFTRRSEKLVVLLRFKIKFLDLRFKEPAKKRYSQHFISKYSLTYLLNASLTIFSTYF